MCDLLSSNIGPGLHHFGDMLTLRLKIQLFRISSYLTSLLGVSPFKFMDEPYLAKTEVMELSIYEDLMIQAWVILVLGQTS